MIGRLEQDRNAQQSILSTNPNNLSISRVQAIIYTPFDSDSFYLILGFSDTPNYFHDGRQPSDDNVLALRFGYQQAQSSYEIMLGGYAAILTITLGQDASEMGRAASAAGNNHSGLIEPSVGAGIMAEFTQAMANFHTQESEGAGIEKSELCVL